MQIIIDLEKSIKTYGERISLSRQQIVDNEAGKIKLTIMALASAEASIEKNTILLLEDKEKLAEFRKQDLKELIEKQQIKDEVEKKNYYKYQKIRIKRAKTKTDAEKDEALMLLDELPMGISIEDKEIFEIAEKSMELHLSLHWNVDKEFNIIKEEFNSMIENVINDTNQELTMLNYRIPTITLQLHILMLNIIENIDEDKLSEFKGFPKFEDWWIEELWTSHQAYLGLYKWKNITEYLCITTEQKRAWEKIFKNWIFVKKMLNKKGKMAHAYNNAFDKLISKYAELEEEYDENNLRSMKNIVEQLTKTEDFFEIKENHNIITPYSEYKMKKVNKK